MTGVAEPREFSSNDVIDATGVSARQLQYWDTCGLICPVMKLIYSSRGGTICRRYSAVQVIEVRLLNESKVKGFHFAGCMDRLMSAIRKNRGRYLITDGKKFSYATADAGLSGAMMSASRPTIVLDLKEYNERKNDRRLLSGRHRQRHKK